MGMRNAAVQRLFDVSSELIRHLLPYSSCLFGVQKMMNKGTIHACLKTITPVIDCFHSSDRLLSLK